MVVASDEVEADWHPRHCDTEKTYEYKILNSKFPDPMRRRDTYHVSFDLDLEKMREAAGYLKGEHDFGEFVMSILRWKIRFARFMIWK